MENLVNRTLNEIDRIERINILNNQKIINFLSTIQNCTEINLAKLAKFINSGCSIKEENSKDDNKENEEEAEDKDKDEENGKDELEDNEEGDDFEEEVNENDEDAANNKDIGDCLSDSNCKALSELKLAAELNLNENNNEIDRFALSDDLVHYLVYHKNNRISFGNCPHENKCKILLNNDSINLLERIHLVFYHDFDRLNRNRDTKKFCIEVNDNDNDNNNN